MRDEKTMAGRWDGAGGLPASPPAEGGAGDLPAAPLPGPPAALPPLLLHELSGKSWSTEKLMGCRGVIFCFASW